MSQAVAQLHSSNLLPVQSIGTVERTSVSAPIAPVILKTNADYQSANPQIRAIAIAFQVVLAIAFAATIIYLPSQHLRALEQPKTMTVSLHAEAPKPPRPNTAQLNVPPPRAIQPVFVPPPLFEISTPTSPISQVTHAAPTIVVPPTKPAELPPPSNDVLSAYQVLLRAAVQQAVMYPVAARAAGVQGNARVAFDFQNGRVSNPEIIQSSGSTTIDRAAIAAVTSASIPLPPAELVGRIFRFAIVVTFSLSRA